MEFGRYQERVRRRHAKQTKSLSRRPKGSIGMIKRVLRPVRDDRTITLAAFYHLCNQHTVLKMQNILYMMVTKIPLNKDLAAVRQTLEMIE